MLSGLGWTRHCRPAALAVRCKAKSRGFGGTATKPQHAKPKKGAKRVSKEVNDRKQQNMPQLHPYAVIQQNALESLHQHLASGVTPAHSSQLDPGATLRFDEQNQDRLRSSLAGSAVGTGVLDIEQREQGLNKHGATAEAGVADVIIDVDFEPAQQSPHLAVHELVGASEASSTGAHGSGLLEEEELASRIARLWDDVPDELRQLMANAEEPGLDAAVLDAALVEDPAGGLDTAPHQSTGALHRQSTAASSTMPADLDALLAPLQAMATQGNLNEHKPAIDAAAPDFNMDKIDSNSTDTIDYSKIAEQFKEFDAAEMETMLTAAAAAAEQQESTAGAQDEDEDDGDSSIGSMRVMALQQEVASANKKVQLLQQQLQDSEEHARLLAQELKLLQLQSTAGAYTTAHQQQAQDQRHQHQQLLSDLEVQVAQIANELLMVSLSMKNIDTTERRRLRAIVNELLALKFGTPGSQ